MKEGLSQNTVTTMIQDDRGYVWMGTKDGLNRFDGYDFIVFRNSKGDSTALSSNSITSLFQDTEGILWVGTSFGLNRFDPKSFETRTYFHWFEDSLTISSNFIKSIGQDAEGNIWVGTDNGLNRLNDEDSSFIRYEITEGDSTSLPGKEVRDILLDDMGALWIATEGGLASYNSFSDSFKRYRYKFDDDNSLSNNNIFCLEKGDFNTVWIGTRQGLNELKTDSMTFRRYNANQPKREFLSSDIIQSLLYDNKGDLWVGTPSGLNKLFDEREKSIVYRYGENELNSLPNDYILSLLLDRSGVIWVGTQSAGVATLDREAPQFNSVTYSNLKGYEPEQNRIYGFSGSGDTSVWVATGQGINLFDIYAEESVFNLKGKNHPINRDDCTALAVKELNDSMLYVGTAEKGLWQYNVVRDELKIFEIDSEDSLSLTSNKIIKIADDQSGNLWLGSAGGGLIYFDVKTEQFESFRFDGGDPNSIRDNNVISLALDNNGLLYAGTGNAGLYILDTKSKQFIARYHVKSNDRQIPDNSINSIMVGSDGILWLGTNGEGLVRIDRDRDSVVVYNRTDGLANQVVHGITKDVFGIIWLSTNAGLTAFNEDTRTFRNYTEEVVLGKNTFLQGSFFRDGEGVIYFGGANGFDYFNSIGLRENDYSPSVSIVGYNLYTTEGSDTLQKMIYSIDDTLAINADYTGVSFTFSALSFKQPEKNQYAFRLLGVFDEWQYIGTRRYVSFSTVTPGTYTFEVIGSNNDGLWSKEPARVTLIVEASIWETAWFRIAMVFVVFAILFLINRYQIESEKARRKVLEHSVSIRTKEIAKERDTNVVLLREVHHRVKNNLQIIVSLLSLQSHYIKDKSMLDVFSEIQNRVRSMSLIHQKMYKTKNLASVNLKEYLDDLAQNLLDTYRVGQSVNLSVDISVDRFSADTLTPLGLIINEIFSNSLKYAFPNGEEGTITVALHQVAPGKFQLIIGDNGVGFPDDFEEEKDSFGSELIEALTEQLNGTLIVRDDLKGAFYQLDFEDVGSDN
ncbi:triple tyrosine motif-containing protein [Cryomorphaceae bacterium 1068]|nr:triple tyrosine motif-containing protein [Cryomorphaceae bacterium 1068]